MALSPQFAAIKISQVGIIGGSCQLTLRKFPTTRRPAISRTSPICTSTSKPSAGPRLISCRASLRPCYFLPVVSYSAFTTSLCRHDGPNKESQPPRWRPPSEESLNERPVLVVGAGNIGRRVALVWASIGRPVTIYDISPDALHSATLYITDNLAAYCTERGTHPGHVRTTTDLRTATGTSGHPERDSAGNITPNEHTKAPWQAIECLPESLPLKTSVLALLERSLPSDCILASNSSSLTTAEMAAEGPLGHPHRLLNTHYLIPPRNRMVELMSSGATSGAVLPFLAAQMRRVGFTPVVVPRDIQSRGFVFNRIWAATKRETLAVLSEGVAKPADVDALFRDFFHAEKGPCERMDEVGLDTVASVEQHDLERQPGLGASAGSEAALRWLRENYVAAGKLGEKSGDGLFTGEERDALREKHHWEKYKDVEETSGA
ncbi:NAD(P)-binding protein [Parathielavia hyrcaniae]|uniref:NAD(P)-binding protein n=1 Tax=Parathielavia hyrcaniae TaxID=113614 RepID=A0AAN6T3H6_9PEZI|nr:NAD(P)-binding protein [Parathielavia hyrcaniae]